MYNKIILLSRSICKTIVWTTWNSIFGLAPIFVIYFIKSYDQSNEWLTYSFMKGKILSDGIILFFCTALMGAVCIDYILIKKNIQKYFLTFIITLSLATLSSVSIIFGDLFFHPNGNYNLNILYGLQNFFILLSGCFCLVFKTILFYKE